jgi:hypothetical protein
MDRVCLTPAEDENDSPERVRVPHRRTGKPRGARPGNAQTVKHGLKTAAMIENRRAYVALMKAAREAIRDAH